MIVPEIVAEVGAFLLEHSDVVEEVAKAIAGGAPKDAIKAAIRGVVVEISDAAIREELHAAAERRAKGLP